MKKITKVLLVDDDVLILKTVGKILLQRGYEVFTTGTAKGIVTTVIACQPDVILMDHYMPDVTGKQAIKALRNNELTRPIPVIYFSTFESLDVLAKEVGADAYVSKTGTMDDLTSKIDTLSQES
jgi:CheY-like chemotaxis protein